MGAVNYSALIDRLRVARFDDGQHGSLMDEAADAIERLQRTVDQQRRDAIEEQRAFQREAREIAAEARWQASQGDEFGSY